MNKNPLLRMGIALLAFLLCTGLPAQEKGGIALNFANEPLEKVMESIQRQTRYLFVNIKVDLKQRVSVKIKDKTIEEALKAIFEPIHVDFKIEGNNIVIKPGTGAASPRKKDRKVTGKLVSADGQPVVGGGVQVKGTSIGVVTDLDGNFEILVPAGQTSGALVFSCVGFEDVEQPLGERSTYHVTMKDNLSLQEVVIVGYGSQKKEFVLGSVSQVTSKDILKAPSTNATNMIAGKLSGITAIQRSGEPGSDNAGILVRGLATYNSNNGPLFIIDGMESSSMSYLNPNDIASISVLKDAATASIYGVKGGNGVILITTRSGSKSDRSVIAYDGSATLTRNTRMPELLDADGYIYWHNLARTLDGSGPVWTEETLAKMDKMGILGNTDWRSLVFRDFGAMQQHNLSARGGNDRFSYFSSIGYMGQDGIVRNTGFKRYNIRANIDAKLLTGMRYNINMAGRYSKKHRPGYDSEVQSWFNPITRAYYSIPLIKNTYNGLPLGLLNGESTCSPDSGLTESGYNDTEGYEMSARSTLEYSFDSIDFLKGLKISLFGGFDFQTSSTHSYMHSYKLYYFDRVKIDVFPTVSDGIGETSFTKATSFSWRYNLRPQVIYERTFGKHGISATGLFEKTKNYYDDLSASKFGYVAEKPMNLNAGSKILNPPSGTYFHTGDVGFAGRLSYVFDDRYLAEFSFREAATYIFSPKNRWGFFPSVSLGWILSRERFVRDNVSWIDHLKLKASAGQMGSNDCSPYLYQKRYRSNAPGYFYGFGGKPAAAFYTDGYVYDDLTWSHLTSYNVGFEARLLNDKLTVEFDWFYKYTDRILDQSGSSFYAPSLGLNHPSWVNTGKMDDRGLELILQHDNWLPSGLNYSIRGMVSWARNRVLERVLADDHPSYRAVLGHPLGEYFGYRYLGIFQTQEQVDNAPNAPSGYSGIGEIMYEDVNGDGKFTRDQDYVKVGRPSLPEINFSLNFDLSFRNWSLSALFYGVAICDYPLSGYYTSSGHTDGTIYTRPFYGNGTPFKYIVERAWRPDHTDTKYPRLHAAYNSNNDNFSDLWVVDGAYLRLKNLQLSYSIPQQLTRKAGVERASLYLAGTNLFTLTEFPYLDPESPGINNGYYPQQKTYSLGINLTF